MPFQRLLVYYTDMQANGRPGSTPDTNGQVSHTCAVQTANTSSNPMIYAITLNLSHKEGIKNKGD